MTGRQLRDGRGRFSGRTPDEVLLEQVYAAVEKATTVVPDPDDPPLDPWEVTLGQFDTYSHLVAAELGHVVKGREALRRIRIAWEMPELTWDQFVRTLFQPERDLKRIHAKRSGVSDRVILTDHVVFALLLVYDWILENRDDTIVTLEPEQYDDARDGMLEAAGAHRWHIAARLPTANQLGHACGGWDAALAHAGLSPRPKRRQPPTHANACPIPVAWAAYVAENGTEPSYKKLNEWMRDERGVALESRAVGRPWNSYRDMGRAQARRRGIWFPKRGSRTKPEGWRPGYVDLGSYAPHRGARKHPRLKVVGDVHKYVDQKRSAARSDDRSWRSFARANSGVVSVGVIKDHGGLASLIAEARRPDWRQRAEAWEKARAFSGRPERDDSAERIIRLLAEHAQLTNAELRRLTGIQSRQGITYQLDRLIAAGRVEPLEENPRSPRQAYRPTKNYRRNLSGVMSVNAEAHRAGELVAG